jgi:hypothetical protein
MINWHLTLGIVAGIIAFASIIPYVKDILHGTTRPNIVSYGLWALLLSIGMLGQISSGASWSIIFLLGDLLAVLAVITLCLMGYGYGKYGKLEWTCVVLAIIAIVSWQITDRPLLAIIFALIADMLAAIPTIVKTYYDPRSELPLGWFMVAFGGVLGIASNTIFDLPNLLFPVYVVLINGTVGVLALRYRIQHII